MTEQQNTRPSASREIAVKKLEWGETDWDVNEFGEKVWGDFFEGSITLTSQEGHYGIYKLGAGQFMWVDGTDSNIRYSTYRPLNDPYWVPAIPWFSDEKSAQQGAQADYERRILSAIDTTPGNTDPIAKDDELRKVRGGWRKDIITEYVYLPIPDESHDWSSRFRWHDVETDLRGFGKTELDAVFDLFRNALDYEYGDGSEQESILDAAWIGIGGSHPTEQPSVRDAARVLLDYLPNYAMENAALESRARDDEGEFASLSDLLDFSGQNKAYTVVREALAAALRSLAQEGE